MPVHHSLISQHGQSTVSGYCLISVSVSACSAEWNVIITVFSPPPSRCCWWQQWEKGDSLLSSQPKFITLLSPTLTHLLSSPSSSSSSFLSLFLSPLLMLQQGDSNLGIRWVPPWEPPGTLWHHSTSAAPDSHLTHPGSGCDECYRVRFIPRAYGRYETYGFLAVVQWRYWASISIWFPFAPHWN